MLGAAQARGRQLRNDLRGVCHARMGQVYVGERVGANDSQPVVRVREPHAGARAGHCSPEAQHGTLEGTDLRGHAIEETGAEDEGQVLLVRAINHRSGIGRIVLAVRVEGDDVAGPTRQGCLETGLQGCSLAEIERMDRRVSPGGASDGGGVVTRGVVHNKDVGERSAHACDDAPDDGRLVKRGNHDPRVGTLLHFSSVAHRSGRAPIVLLSGGQRLLSANVLMGPHKGDTVIEPSADVAPSAQVASSARVWHLAQVREEARIGEETIVGRGAYIGEGVVVGPRCKIQNYALIYEPASLAEGVFVGPAAVFTNDHCPRAINADGTLKDASDWEAVGVTVERGAAIGARAVCVAPVRIGAWASVGAGAVVTRDVAPYALVVGVPARRVGWVGEAGVPLVPADHSPVPGNEAVARTWVCPASGRRYVEREGTLEREGAQASSTRPTTTPDPTPEDDQ